MLASGWEGTIRTPRSVTRFHWAPNRALVPLGRSGLFVKQANGFSTAEDAESRSAQKEQKR